MASRLSVKFLSGFAVLALASASCVMDGSEEDVSTVSLEAFTGNCSVTLAVTPASPVNAGTAVTATASATCGGGAETPEYVFYRRSATGTWSIAQAYGASNVLNWDTTGAITGDYIIQAWARAVGSNAAYEGTSTARTMTVDNGSSSCYGTTLVGAPASPVTAGTGVEFTASSTCTPGATAEYKFYVRNTSGVWSVAQAYSASATLNWDTTGLTLGNYNNQVWTRAVGNVNTLDSSKGTTYSVTTPACSAITLLTPTPTTPGVAGEQITLTATATCPDTGEFQFWIRRPTNTWFNLGAYSISTSANWDTTGLDAGTYAVQAWVRRVGNVSTYDKSSTLKSYVLTAP